MKEDAEKGGGKDDDANIDGEDGDNDDDDNEWEGFDEDEDVNNPNDEAYMSAMNKLSSGGDISQFLMGDGWDEDDEELDDDFHSPIDNVDELHYLNDVLRAAYVREPDAYRQVQSALSTEVVTCCQQLFAAVDAQRAVTPSP